MKNLENEKGLKTFTISCLLNEYNSYDYKGSVDIIKKYYEEANSLNEFVQKVLNDERLANNQGYWKLVEEKDADNYNVRVLKLFDKLEAHKFTTISDAGSLKVGNSSFSTLFSNGYGDCENLVYIIDREINLHCLEFKTIIEGSEINIYEYDCGNKVIATLSGKYALYSHTKNGLGNKIFAFVKIN